MKSKPSSQIKIIKGGLAVDERGIVTFVNDFNLKNIKRFYQVENFSKETVRAFHGHLKETKYVYVVSGAILLVVVYLDNIKSPSKKNKAKQYVLFSHKPEILYIPPRHANGFKVLENNTRIIFFSTSTLEESKKDDYRYPYDYWGKDVWRVKNY